MKGWKSALLPDPSPRADENGYSITGTWVEDGQTFHQVVTRAVTARVIMCEILKEKRRVLVNVAGLRRVAMHPLNRNKGGTPPEFGVVLIFTDVKEAVYARLRWG